MWVSVIGQVVMKGWRGKATQNLEVLAVMILRRGT